MKRVKKSPVVVLAAIIRREGRYLLTRRLPDARWNAGRWEFPGGKLEFGEDLAECLRREIREETGLDISVGAEISVSSHLYGNELHVVLVGFLCGSAEGDVTHTGIADHRWVTVEEMAGFDMTEADLPIVDALRKTDR